MRFAPLIALALGNVALAQNGTTSGGPGSGQPPSPTNPPGGGPGGPGGPGSPGSPGGGDDGFPARIGNFEFLGCFLSRLGFPTFNLAASSPSMSLGACAASCPTDYFGVYNTDCYCGETISNSTASRVSTDMCDTVCPGDEDQFCGGMSQLAVRQNVPASVLLTVYVRVADEPGSPGTGSPTTSTVTSTSTGTITSCPPEVTDCPIGSSTVETITTLVCPTPTPVWHERVIICYGDYCVIEHCPDNKEYHVVCVDNVCHVEEGSGDQIVVCHGDECKYSECGGDECLKKVVCYGDECFNEKCYGDECYKKLVCEGETCHWEECNGADCHTKVICEGEECKEAPPCTGPECPTPAPPTPVPVTPTPSPSPTIPVGGSGKTVPALGLGALAGLVMFL